MDGHEARLGIADDGSRGSTQELIEVQHRIEDIELPCLRFNFIEIANRSSECLDKVRVLGDVSWVGGHQIVDVVRVGGGGPEHTGGDDAGLGGRLPQGWDFEIASVPVPCILVLIQRVETRVVIDAVLLRPHPRDQGGMAGKGYGGNDSNDSVCIHAIF